MKFIIFALTLPLFTTMTYAGNDKISPYLDSLKTHDQEMIKNWKNNAPIALERLICVKFSYVDFDGKIHDDGEFIVLDAVAEHVFEIMKILFNMKFPIALAKRIDFFEGDDLQSMQANNSSCFNCRLSAENSGLPSVHAYGLAIDINPHQNPFVSFESSEDREKGLRTICPIQGSEIYLNRRRAQNDNLPGLAEDIVDVFRQHGFHIWGGNWNDPIDWQHFQPSRAMAQILAAMTPEHAKLFFNLHVKSLKKNKTNFMTNLATKNNLVTLYEKNADIFIKTFQNDRSLMDSTDIKTVIDTLEKEMS